MVVTVEKLNDLWLATRRGQQLNKWTDLTSDLQRHVAMTQLLTPARLKTRSGSDVQFNIMTKNAGSARTTGLYEQDSVGFVDVMAKGNAPWRHTTNYYGEDARALNINASDEIVDLMTTKRAAAFASGAELFEGLFWGKPLDTSDEKSPFGLFTWVVPGTVEGFNGGNPTGFASGIGGLDSTVQSRWANWTGQYNYPTAKDLIAKMVKAHHWCEFISPLKIPGGLDGRQQNEIYTDWYVYASLLQRVNAQNDNLGPEVSFHEGRVYFHSNPVIWVPMLETANNPNITTYAGTHPVIGVSWQWMEAYIRKGWFQRESKPAPAPWQHTVSVVFIDTTMQFINRNRRSCWLLNQA